MAKNNNGNSMEKQNVYRVAKIEDEYLCSVIKLIELGECRSVKSIVSDALYEYFKNHYHFGKNKER